MPRSVECLISIDVANALKELAETMKVSVLKCFRCPECGKAVRAHVTSEKGKGHFEQAAHFEHIKKNTQCSR